MPAARARTGVQASVRTARRVARAKAIESLAVVWRIVDGGATPSIRLCYGIPTLL
jgi:hypothetical protein